MTKKNYRSVITRVVLLIATMPLSGGGWAGSAYFKNIIKKPIAVSLTSIEQGTRLLSLSMITSFPNLH
jgi:hypothetical protein